MTKVLQADFWRTGKWAVIQIFALVLLLLGIAAVAFNLPEELALQSRTEDGVLEKLTIAFYGVAIVVCLAVVFFKRWIAGYCVVILLAVMCMREMDFHKRPTQTGKIESVTSTRYWRSGDVAILEKVVIAIVLIAAIYAVVTSLRTSSRRWFADFKNGSPYAISVAGFFLFPFLSIVIDKLVDVEELDQPVVLFFSLAEESIEIGIPIMACIALVQWARADSSKKQTLPIDSQEDR